MTKRFAAIWFLVCIFFPSLILRADDNEHLRSLIAAAGEKEKYPGANTVVVFDSTTVKVMDSGLSHVTMHRLSKVLTAAGAIELSVQHFGYDPLSAFVEVKSTRIFRKGGEVEEISPNAILDCASPARMIYWGAREKMVPVGRLEIGDALETVVFRKGFTYALLGDSLSSAVSSSNGAVEDERYVPPMRGHFYDIVPFWSSVPVLLKSYTASLPSDKQLQYEVYNGELASWIHFEGEHTTYHWEKKDIQPFESETNMVAASDVAPKLLLSTSPDWIAKSLWFYKVNEDYGSFEVTPEVKAKVEQLTRNCKNVEEQVSVLTHWVAEEGSKILWSFHGSW